MDAGSRIEKALTTSVSWADGRGCPPRLAAALRHAVFPKGSRIRPRLCLAVADACGGRNQGVADAAAAAIELLHCASLVHDDLPCFDNAATRRGKPTVHAAFGEPLAVLAGDALIVLAFETVARGASCAPDLLPALLLMSLGLGAVFVVISSTALFNVPFHESGVASAVLNTTQQIGGSLGTAVFNTVAISATAAYALAHPWRGPSLPAGVTPPDALTHGFSVAFELGSACMLAAAIVFFFMVNVDRHHLGQHDDVGEPDEEVPAS